MVLSLAVVADVPAATTVVSNQTIERISVACPRADESVYRVLLGPEQSVPLHVSGAVPCEYSVGDEKQHTVLQPNAVYYFASLGRGRVELRRMDLGSADLEEAPEGVVDLGGSAAMGKLTLKIMMDDDEVRRQSIWEPRLRKRVVAASKLLEFYCRTRLEIVDVSLWDSDDRINDFEQTLSEFEKSVPRGRAQLVIGFTSQYPLQKGRSHLGGTRGPLHSHILIRENGPRIGEVERLEVLLHELGHFFGAAHSPEEQSLMRPILGDGKANSRAFRITYDPLNILAINLIAEKRRTENVRRIEQLPRDTRRRLLGIYDLLSEAQPDDPAAKNLAAAVRSSLPRDPNDKGDDAEDLEAVPDEQARIASQFEGYVRAVVAAIGQEAAGRAQLDFEGVTPLQSSKGDELTAAYVSAAALAASKAPPESAVRVFYVGLAVALDREKLISRLFPVAQRIRIAESDERRAQRLKLIGEPTIHGRTDLLQHFIAVGILTTISGPKAAEAAGLLKEIRDGDGPTGFSFADICANVAGIRFAQALVVGELSLEKVALGFTVDAFVPPVDGLPNALSSDQFRERYGTIYGEACREELNKIRARVDELSGYRR